MNYTNEKIDKIINYKSIRKRDKISRLLEIDAIQYCNLGIDSTKSKRISQKK